MIDSVNIRNFQGIERLDIDLDDKVTCIVGPTDSGKSSVLRAFRWLALNDRRGDKFIRRGQPGCTVAASVDGREITRRKGRGKNDYSLDGEALEFGVGEATAVPEPIAKLLRLNGLNFAQQHEPPFWFSETAGQASRRLNAIVDLGVIDDVLARAAKELNRLRAEKNVREEDLAEAKADLTATEWAEAFDAALKPLEELKQEVEDLDGEADALEAALEEAARLRKAASRKAPDLAALEALAADIAVLEAEEAALTGLLDEVAAAGAKSAKLKKEAAGVRAELKRKLDGQCPVCGGEWKP